MKWIAIILGILTGKRNVRCKECKNLNAENQCFGKQMPDEALNEEIACGFWKAKNA